MDPAGAPPNPRVWLEVEVGGRAVGRVVCELRADVVPKTAENFRALCTGERGVGRRGKPLHLKGCVFHRIIPGFMCQGGDFTRGDGTGGESVYGAKFADENFALKHTGPGILSMANSGPDTNGSQFFLCLESTPWLDGKHVVFGQVVSGKEVLKKMESAGTKSGKTKERVVVVDCGEEELPEPAAGTGGAAPAEEFNPDAASLKRLQSALNAERGGAGPPAAAPAPAKPLPFKTAQDELKELEEARGAPAPEGGVGKAAAAPAPRYEPEPEADAGQPSFEHLTGRARKLAELRAKMQDSRRQNQSAVLVEQKRQADPTGGRKDSHQGWKKRGAAALEAHGLKETEGFMLQTQEDAEKGYKKKEKKPAPFGWEVFNQKSLYNAYKKRTNTAQHISMEEYEATKAAIPSFYRDADSLELGQAPPASEEAINRMVGELEQHREKRAKFSRRRAHREGRDIDSINDRNAHFNRKIARQFDQYTGEIKANLERGTALPE